MTTTLTNQSLCTTYSRLKTKPEYVINRYLLAVVKARYNESQWLYHNGAEGLSLAILNGQVEDTYQDALEELSSREGKDIDIIEADYQNWYYKYPISDVIETLEHNVAYYSQIK